MPSRMFPQGYVPASNTSIPYWATVNPATWPNELFDIDQAQDYTNQNHSDYWPLNSTPGSGSSGNSIDVGAIIGGTIGGIAALLFVLIGGYFLFEHRKSRGLRSADGPGTLPSDTYTPTASAHTHWLPYPSTVISPTPTGLSAPISYGNGQRRGIGMDILPPTSYSTIRAASPPATDTASFLTAGNAAQRIPAVPMI